MPGKMNDLLSEFQRLPGFNQILSPWQNQATFINGNRPYNSLLNTYGWIGDLQDTKQPENRDAWVNGAQGETSYNQYLDASMNTVRNTLLTDRIHANHLHFGTTGLR
jgi:hypothetical protein